MSQSDPTILVPPRLLAGVAVIYWGAMMGEAFVGLVMAVLLEARSWVKFRWKISEVGYVKAFYVSLFLVAVALVLIRMDTVDVTSFWKMIKWSPLFFLPIELAQRYGEKDRMYLNTFFYFSRQRMRQDLKEGRQSDPMSVNTGYPYIIGVLVVSSCSERHDLVAIVGMVVIVMALLFSVMVSTKMRWQKWIWAGPLLLLVMALNMFLAKDFNEIATKLRYGSGFNDEEAGGGANMEAQKTNLGKLGKVKQSESIVWRVWADDGVVDSSGWVPQYLTMSYYNVFRGRGWRYDYRSEGFEDMSEAFEKGIGQRVGDDSEEFVFRDVDLTKVDSLNDAPRMKVRGAGNTETSESLVPSFEGFAAVTDVSGEYTVPAVNTIGSLKLVDRETVIDYQLIMTDTLGGSLLNEPNDALDTKVHKYQKEVVDELAKQMKLASYESPQEKVAAIRLYFIEHFQYAMHFESEAGYGGSDLETFMLHDRRGHCEYFATVATLLLRNEGIPARYAVGYVLREKDDEMWVVRGAHAHAWCVAWIDGEWRTVDVTPPSWLDVEQIDEGVDFWQSFKDGFQKIREDFQAWKSVEENNTVFNRWLFIIGGLVIIWYSWRLWKRRNKVERGESELSSDYVLSKEMKAFEKSWAKQYGVRSTGQTYRNWLTQTSIDLPESKQGQISQIIDLHESLRFKSSCEGMQNMESRMLKLLNSILR